MDNRETPLKFVGKKKVPEGISKGTGFKGIPTEQQKYYVFKNYTEPALLLKNQQQESKVIKAIKKALGVKTVVENASIVDNFGFKDEGAQQKAKREEVEAQKKIRKEKLDLRIDQGRMEAADGLTRGSLRTQMSECRL